MEPPRNLDPRDALTLLRTGIAYWLTIAPTARSELGRWRRFARSIVDPALRKHALEKLSNEALNAEAAAIFAVLAPKASRPRLVRLIVAYQVMYDYLDAVNEDPAFMPVSDGLQLHRALIDAVQSQQISTDYYGHHPQHDDGGYLNALVGACHDALDICPSRAHVTPALIAAATRCREAQARNHAVPIEGSEQLIHWSEKHPPGKGYIWWELAAAGVSSLAIHALFAAAATPNTIQEEAQRIDTAYFPAVCAISTLLDSLIDLPRDADTTNHSFAAHYTSSGHVAKRYAAIIADAEEQLGGLRHARRHRIILAGITGYYLSAHETDGDFAHPVTISTIEAAGPMTRLILAVMRIRRWGYSFALFKKKFGSQLPKR